MAKQKSSPRRFGVILDGTHVFLGLCVVASAAFAIMDPAKYRWLFPVVFLLASAINFLTAYSEYKMYSRDRKKLASVIIYAAAGVLIFALFAVSAISIWGNS